MRAACAARHHPRKRAIQYAAASRFNRCRLWNTGSPGQAGRRQPSAFPQHEFARVLQFRCPSVNRGRRESRAPTAPAAPCAMVDKNAHGFDRYSRDIPAFPARRLYSLYVLFPVSGLFCHRRRQVKSTDLTPGSRRQNHTTSPYAASLTRQRGGKRPSHPTARFVTIAIRPFAGWDERTYATICYF